MSTEYVPIVLAFTPNYYMPAAVCISSILKHSETGDHFHIVCLLSEPLSENLQQQLHRLGGVRARYSFIDLQGKLQGIYVNEKFTIAASYRLLLPDLLPEYDRVMYIDCDVVVRNNLAHLYRSVDLRENYLAAVFEPPLDFQLKYLRTIGCEESGYVNSGFMLMNLALLRKNNMVEKFVEASKEDGLEFQDQDVINKLCKGHILPLHPYYNGIRTFYLPQYKSSFLKLYSEDDWQSVQQHGTVHYTGTKPWKAFTVQFNVWWFYYEQLPTEVKHEGQINRKIYRLYKFYNTRIGGWSMNTFQSIYRKIKHKQT